MRYEPTNPIIRDKEYYTTGKYKYLTEIAIEQNSVICKNCGWSYGHHNGTICPPIKKDIQQDFVNPK